MQSILIEDRVLDTVPNGDLKIVSVDPSISSTGVVNNQGAQSIKTKTSWAKFDRIEHIVDGILEASKDADLVVIEGYSFGSKGRALIDLGENGGVIRWELRKNGLDYFEVDPKRIKKFATNNGNSEKDEILARAIRESPEWMGVSNNNESDAFFLRELALGYYDLSNIELHQYRREIIDSIDWPNLKVGV